jgi:hypothetical protein
MTEPHYDLQAYVCGPGCTSPSPFEGWATFQQIFNARPHECRYAVVREAWSSQYVVWDMYHDDVTHRQNTHSVVLLRPPPPLWTGPTADSMIMKAMMLYGRD